MSNSTVLSAIVAGLFAIVLALVGFWVKRIEGKDRLFRSSVSKDMRVMYAMKDDYSHLHTWALEVRGEWRQLQNQLRASGVITEIHDLPPIPEPEWKRIEDGDE